MIKTKDGYAKLIGTTYSGSVSRVLLSNGGDHILGNSSSNIPLNNGTVNTNLNADMLDGLHIHAGRNNEANKIVRTDANGFLLTGWINTTSGDIGTGAINKIYCSNDDYIRYKTPANFFPTLANSGNNISITVAGLNRTLTIGYATNADTVDKYHANTIYNAPSFTVNNSNTSNTYILLATITISGTSLSCAEFTTLFQNRECLDSSSFILSGAIRRNSTTNVTATLSYITLHTKTPRNIYLRSDDGVTFRVYILSATSTYTTYYRAIPIVDSRNITYSNTGTTSPISGSVLNITATKGGNTNYANSAGNADTLDNYHANGLLTALSNSNNGISITVGGTTKSISNINVNYATSAGNADTVDGYHASAFATAEHNHFDRLSSVNIDTGLSHTLNRHYEVNNATGTLPFISNWHQVYVMGGYDSSYTTQICTGLNVDNSLYFRHRINTTWNSWRTILDSVNYNDYAPTKTGGGASGTWNISISGNATTASKLGTSTIGATNIPIYLNGGTPTAVNLNSTANNLINNLTTGTSTPTDADYYVSQYVGGGTTTITYHRRPHSSLYNYIKNKASGTWNISISGNAATASKATTADTAGALYSVAKTDPGSACSDGQNVKWFNNIAKPSDLAYAGTNAGFPVTNNANGILWLGTHSGPYGWQIGFSSNSRIYARYINNNTFPKTANGGSWNKIAWTSDIPTVTNYWWANVKISNTSNTDTLPTFGYATIKNRLSISSSTLTKTNPTHLQLVINGPNLLSSATPGLKDWPGIGFHMPSRGWASLIYNGNITAINSDYNGYINYFGAGFKKNGSNDTYVLLGGGGHKLISDFATSGHVHNYLALSGGTMTGVIKSTFKSSTWINGVTNAVVKGEYTDYGAILSMPVKDGRVSISSYPSSDNYIYFGYATSALISANTNSFNKKMYWDAANNKLVADTFLGALLGNASTATALTTSAGSASLPIYFSGGKPVACTKSSIFSNLSNNGELLSITIAGYNRLLTVAYASRADSAVDADYAASSDWAEDALHASSADNADTCDYLHVHTGRNYEANKIVRTDTSGHIQCGYINSSSGHEKNASSPTYVWGSNSSDSYLRSYQTNKLSVNYANSTNIANYAYNSDKLDGYDSDAFALKNHTHDLNLASSTETSSINLVYGNNYKLTAGGKSIIFTLPLLVNPASYYWANINIDTSPNTSTTPTFGKVMININKSLYQLNVGGDSYTIGWSRSTNGFYCEGTGIYFTHNGTKGEISVKNNNEFCWGSNSDTLYFNYAAPSNGTTVKNYIWNAGSGSTYASHTMGNIILGSNSNSNYQLKRAGSLSDWYNGRDKAIIRQTSAANGYSVVISSKTTNGSWEIGNESNDLMFTYITDSNYNSKNDDFSGLLYITSEGEVHSNNDIYAIHFFENSDIRYKKILKNLSINSNTIANLPLFDFEWIENNAIGTGTSALAVQQILPNLVSGTDRLTLDYGVLGTIAGITACKELVMLKSELLQLKEKVKLLEDKLRKYENI